MMRYIEKEVRDVVEDPRQDETVELLLGYKKSAPTFEIQREVEKLGGDVLEELPFRTLRVKVPQSQVETLCELGGLESVEFDSEARTLQGNLDSLPASHH